MELSLTKSQKDYLDKKGVISASSLQKAYKQSVQEQRSIIKEAQKLRKAKNTK